MRSNPKCRIIPRWLQTATGLFYKVKVVCPEGCNQLLFETGKQSVQHSAFGRALETGRAWRGSAALFAPTRKKLKKNQSFVWSKVDLCMIGRSLLFVFHNAKLACAADVCN
ncbi:hypothetical protein A6U97_03105 [Agrobacterium tumefaciens]|nr:hypothetical protein A6U97_03105 [Agrobacterium tumefaciens]